MVHFSPLQSTFFFGKDGHFFMGTRKRTKTTRPTGKRQIRARTNLIFARHDIGETPRSLKGFKSDGFGETEFSNWKCWTNKF